MVVVVVPQLVGWASGQGLVCVRRAGCGGRERPRSGDRWGTGIRVFVEERCLCKVDVSGSRSCTGVLLPATGLALWLRNWV